MATTPYIDSTAATSWSATAASISAQSGDILYVYAHCNGNPSFSDDGDDAFAELWPDFTQTETSNHVVYRRVMTGSETDLALSVSVGTASWHAIIVRGANTTALEVSGPTRSYSSSTNGVPMAGHTVNNPGILLGFGGTDGTLTYTGATNGHTILTQDNAGRSSFVTSKSVTAGTEADFAVNMSANNDATSMTLLIEDGASPPTHTRSPVDTTTVSDAVRMALGKGVTDAASTSDVPGGVTVITNAQPYFVASHYDSGATDPVTVTPGFTLQAGDTIVTLINYNEDKTVIDTDGGHLLADMNDETPFAERFQHLTTQGTTVSVWVRTVGAPANEPSTWEWDTLEWPYHAGDWTVLMVQLRDADCGVTWDVQPLVANITEQATGATNAAASIALSDSKSLSLVAGFSDSSTVFTGADNGHTLVATPATERSTALAYKQVTSAGATGATTLTLAGSTDSVVVPMALLPSPGIVTAKGHTVTARDTTAEMVVQVPSGLSTTVEYSTSADFTGSTTMMAQTPSAANGRRLHFEPTGLNSDTTYYWRVIENGTTQSTVGEFHTQPLEGAAMDFRVAVTGCIAVGNSPTSFNRILAKAVHRAVIHGDYHYRDFSEHYALPTQAQFRGGYQAQTVVPALEEFNLGVSIDDVWDDHEIANNWEGSTAGKANAQAAFRDWWPSSYLELSSGPIYKENRYGNVCELVFDVRSERSLGSARLGATQLAWAEARIAAAGADPDIQFLLMYTVVPLISSTNGDDWSEADAERDAIYDAIYLAGFTADQVLSISGDMHGIAGDDGTNNTYGTEVGAGGWRHIQTGPAGQDNSIKAGPYTDGPWAAFNPKKGQYTIVHFDSATTPGTLAIDATSYDHDDVAVLTYAWNISVPVAHVFADADSVTAADAHALTQAKSAAEPVSAADTSTGAVGKSTADTGAAVDTAAGTVTKPATDSVTVGDAAVTAQGAGVVAADGASAADASTRTVGRDESDAASAVDAATLSAGYVRSVSDAASVSDDAAGATSKPSVDAASVVDAMNAASAKVIADVTTLGDAVARRLTLSISDTGSVADATSVGGAGSRSIADAISTADQIRLSIGKPMSDAAAAVDTVTSTSAQGASPAEGVTVVDAATLAATLSTVDTITVSDVASPSAGGGVDYIASLDDAVAASDTIGKRLTLYISDDISSVSTPPPATIIFAVLD